MDWLWWLAAAFALGVVELFVFDVVVLTLIGGALAGALAAALGADLWVQVVVALATSVILFFTLRPWAMRMLKDKSPLEPMGAEGRKGKIAVVVHEVTAKGGRIKVDGEVWSARLSPEPGVETIPVGADVVVESIDGATAVVSPTTL
jgi:membrane protein implicated in regulation of membrane protease activity